MSGSGHTSDAPRSQGLQRNLGALQIQLIAIGGIIGSAYFLGIGNLVAKLGPSIVLAFLLGGLIVWLVALAMGELCVSMPREGSFVSFAHELVGPSWAAGVGWSYWLNWCAYIASEMIAGGIIMHMFAPAIPAMVWSVLFGLLITTINLLNVGYFGAIESILSSFKICAVALFAILGLAICIGSAGTGAPLPVTGLVKADGLAGLFPAGGLAILLSMVVVLVNFQGTELIALAAAETDNPEKNVVSACRRVAIRIVGIYVIPLLILVSIFPYQKGSISEPVFSAALTMHGFPWAATLFSLVTMSAAFDCANCGLYGTVRALYGLGKEKLAPAAVTRLSAAGVPATATWATICTTWAFLPLFVFFQRSAFYPWLLAVSGFTGAICWISISWCHVRFLKKRDGRAPFWGRLSIVIQLLCLAIVPLSEDFRGCLVIGLPALFIPMAVVYWRERRTKAAAVSLAANG
jgi:amino acid transporter, AAT family